MLLLFSVGKRVYLVFGEWLLDHGGLHEKGCFLVMRDSSTLWVCLS